MSLKQNIYGSLFVSNNITGNTLNLTTINENNSLTQLLVRDNINGVINYRDVSSVISAATSADTFVTGFTYDDSNNLTISRNDGTDFTTNIDIMSGITIDGDLIVTGTTNISGITSINSSLDVYNGTIGLRTNDYFLQGTSTGGTNVQLIGVYSNDEILIGNQGYTNRIMDDTIIKGELDILSGLTLSQTPTLNNSGTDILIRNSSTGEVEYRPVSGITPNTNTFVTGFTYNNANTLTISDNSGSTFNASINTVTGLTSNGDIEVIGDVIVTGGTGNVSSKQFYVEGNLGLDWDFGSNSVTLGNVSDGTIINGTSLTVNSDTTINGNLSATTISATTYFGDGSNLTGITDNFVSGGTYNVGTNNINFSGNNVVTTFDVDLSSLISSVSADTFVISGNADAATSLLTFTNNSGGTFNVTNSAALFSDNDINVTGGTYNPSTGCVTFITNSGTTFDVCGFVTGITDTYTTGSTLVGETIQFDSNVLGPNYYNVSLSPVLSGKTDNLTFNSYTSNTETILNSKVSGATNLSTTGLFAQKNGDNLEFKGLTSTGGTVIITNDSTTVNLEVTIPSDTNTFVTGGTYNESIDTITFTNNTGGTFNVTGVTDTFTTGSTYDNGTALATFTKNDGNTYTLDLSSLTGGTTDTNSFSTGGTVTQSPTSGDSEVILQIVGNSGFTPYNITGLTDTFINDFSISSNTFTISQNDGSSFVATADTIDLASVLSAVTFDIGTSGSISATTFNGGTFNGTFVGDGSGLTGITDNDTFVTGTTFATNQLTLTRNDNVDVFSLSGGSNVTLSETATNDILIDVSLPPSMNTFVTGGTYNESTDTITLTRNDAVTVDITGVTDTFTTGSTYDNGTALATFTKNDGTTYTLDLSTIDVNDTFVTGFTYDNANTFTISRNDGVDLNSSFNTVTGLTVNGTLIVDTISATTYTGLTLNDLDDVTTNIPTTPDATYQGELLYFDTVSNQWVSGEEYGNLGDVTIWGKKGSAGTIDKGCPVYIVGFDSDIHEVELANATTATTMPVIGFTAEDFDNAGVYPIVTFGKVTGVDTTSTVSTINPNGETWAVNDVLFMNTTDGGLTKNRPSGSNTQIQRIAKILKVSALDGQIFVFNTARTAGLPNLTTDYLWVGNGNDTPQEVIKTDVGITTTGFTYNNNNTFTITDDNGGSLSSTINQMSGLTINGTLSATTIDGNTILSGGTNLITIIESLDTNTFVSGGTYNDTTNNINFSGNSVETTFDVDLTSLVSSVSANTFVIAGTYVDSTDTLALLRNDGNFVNVTGITDTFTTGSTYDNSTATATFTRNDGNTYTLDLSTIDVNDTFVTGFTYNNANTFTINRNDGVDLNSSFNTVTGLTVNGTLNATTILSGGTNLTTLIESLDTYVTGGTVSVPATDNTNSGSIGLFYKNSDGTPRTLPFEDTYTTGSTYDNGTALATFDRNDGTSYTLDLSTIDVNDTFSTGGTVTQASSNNENNQTIQIVGNDGFTPYNITNVTDTFTTGGTYNNGTALITFDKNDGTTYDVDLSTLDLNDTFVTGTTFSSNQATVTRNDGTDVLLLTGGTNVTLSNPSTNQIKIDVSTSSSLNITTVSTTTYTATTNDEIIGVDTSSNAVTITLPDSLSSGTLRYEIKDIGFNSRKNPITIQAVGSDSIRTTSLVSSFTLSADGGAVVLINTATREWWQM